MYIVSPVEFVTVSISKGNAYSLKPSAFLIDWTIFGVLISRNQTTFLNL